MPSLDGADLTFADLTGATMTAVDLRNAILRNANLSDVVGWSSVASLEGVTGCDTATKPRPLVSGC